MGLSDVTVAYIYIYIYQDRNVAHSKTLWWSLRARLLMLLKYLM